MSVLPVGNFSGIYYATNIAAIVSANLSYRSIVFCESDNTIYKINASGVPIAQGAIGESKITTGSVAQYWNGLKTWTDFATSVRTSVLTGLSTATNTAITATDSILVAFGKLQAQINARLSTSNIKAGTNVAVSVSGNDVTVNADIPDATTTIKGKMLIGASGGAARYGQKSDVGLGNVDNTSDANKPVSTATQSGLNAKIAKAGDTMTGKLILSASTSGAASVNIPHGAAPATPVNGDMWTTTSAPMININGTSRTIYHNGNLTTVTQAEAEAGTATTARAWTAQRVHQAIANSVIDGGTW